MTVKTVTLKDGPGICELRRIDGEEGFDQARVRGGTFGWLLSSAERPQTLQNIRVPPVRRRPSPRTPC